MVFKNRLKVIAIESVSAPTPFASIKPNKPEEESNNKYPRICESRTKSTANHWHYIFSGCWHFSIDNSTVFQQLKLVPLILSCRISKQKYLNAISIVMLMTKIFIQYNLLVNFFLFPCFIFYGATFSLSHIYLLSLTVLGVCVRGGEGVWL